MEKALIAMSGGVDSSAAALLMQQAGYECAGATMRLFHNEDAGISREKTCCSLDDVQDAKLVCAKLGIPHYVFNFSERFRQDVMQRFADCYECGRTPNPCIDCNRYLKFEKLYERAVVLRCEKLVTGHYARIEERNGEYYLKKALDPTKDQSYVLYSMTQEQLARTLFPLGDLRKARARELAAAHGFVTADKPDSQDICFVPDGDYERMIREYTPKAFPPGDFVSREGRVLGRHRGVIAYTPGQRRGLGIPAGEPLYVCEIRPETNEVVLGTREEACARSVPVGRVNWISGRAPQRALRCGVRIRYRQREQPALVSPVGPDTVRVDFDEPQFAPAPGQAAVFYAGDTLLGGGEILRAGG